MKKNSIKFFPRHSFTFALLQEERTKKAIEPSFQQEELIVLLLEQNTKSPEIEPRTVETLASVRRSNHSASSHPQLG